ncbi:MAG: hypothetical protein V3W09_04195, partial [Nitrososphaerales archaeon]
RLTHSVKVTEHGFLSIDETVEFQNTGTSPSTLQPFELNYASIPVGDISSVAVQGPVDFNVEKSGVNDTARITLTPRSDHQVPSGASATIRIQFYASNLVDTAEEGLFSARLPLVPSMNRMISEVQSNVVLLANSEVEELPSGFVLEDDAGLKKISGVFQDVEPEGLSTQVVEYTLDPAVSLSPLDFPSVERTFKVSSDGSVTVHDEIRVVNRGGVKATKIKLTLLNEDAATIDIVPIGSPPLINRFTTSLLDQTLDLGVSYQTSLSKGEEFLFGIEYPLSLEYFSSVDGVASFDVPVKPPIDGVVERFAIRVDLASGIDVSGEESLMYEDAAPSSAEFYSFSVSLRIVWASEQVMPVATLLFVVVLAALLFGKAQFRRAGGVEKEAPYFEELVTIFEEKTGVIDDIIHSFGSKRKGGAPKSSFSEAQRYFESVKGRAAGKMGAVKSKIISAKPHLKDNLSELLNLDKEYNRAVLDIISLYEKHYTGKIREDTFEMLRSKYQQRLDKAKERLNESIEYIHDEVEK